MYFLAIMSVHSGAYLSLERSKIICFNSFLFGKFLNLNSKVMFGTSSKMTKIQLLHRQSEREHKETSYWDKDWKMAN